MFTITNPKIAGFIPQWSPFKGFSILFDNPMNSLLPFDENKDLKLLSCDITSEELELYKKLNQTLMLFPEMSRTYLFCPLPFQSYHVTLWDGMNDGNIRNVSRTYRLNAEALLEDLPHSFLSESEFLCIHSQPLTINMEKPIHFKFNKLIKWGNSVLVASLKPADPTSQTTLLQIEKERKSLIKKYKECFGLETCQLSYTPHISLGYFANKELAELSTSMIEYWNECFLLKAEEQTITFSSNSLYGFHNMATFYKK